MRAIEITAPGEPSVLKLVQREAPLPLPHQVRIRVHAAGVNRPDILQRKGFYPPPEGASDLPGLEVAGVIDAVGDSASGTVGQRVMALLPGGGYADYAVVHHRHVLPLPDDVRFEEGAGFPETAYTVWANVFEAGGLTPGATLFVHGATSGIGTMACALALSIGARIYGTAGTDEKAARARALGYDDCFNYRRVDWSARMQETGGADVVLDMVGGDYVARNLALLRSGGRHVSIAVQGGMMATINLFDIMRRQLVLTGSTLRARSDAEKARLTEELARQVLPHFVAGRIRPVIGATFPLEKAAEAHQALENGQIVGKVILTL